MKYFLIFFITVFSFAFSASVADKQSSSDKKLIAKIKKTNETNRREIIQKMKMFIGEINGRIDDSNVILSEPVKAETVSGISKSSHVHYINGTMDTVYGYSLSDSLPIYSEPDSSDKTGTLLFAERCEVLIKTETVSDGEISEWIFVRRENGDEGWIDSRYFSTSKPASKKDPKKLIAEKPDTKKFSVPAAGIRTSNFGYRVHPVTKKSGTFHSGIDIAAKAGTPVYAAADGEIATAEFKKNGYGNLIIIAHADDLATYYGHLSKISVRKGKKIKKGDYIGNIGSTGTATGPHLHFEVRKGSKALDPDKYI